MRDEEKSRSIKRRKKRKEKVGRYLHCNNVSVLIADHTKPVAVVSREPVLLVGPRFSSECTSDISLANIKHIKAKGRRKREARVMMER